MADELLNDKKRITPATRVDKKDAAAEHIESDPGTRDKETVEDVKADSAIEDRFEATDN